MNNAGRAMTPIHAILSMEGVPDQVVGLGDFSSHICRDQHDPEETVREIAQVYERLFATYLGEEERELMRRHVELKTQYTRARTRIPDVACQLLHNRQLTHGVRTLAFSEEGRYKDRSLLGYTPMSKKELPDNLHRLAAGFEEVSSLIGLEYELYSRPNCYVAMARGWVHNWDKHPVLVEMVFSKVGRPTFRL